MATGMTNGAIAATAAASVLVAADEHRNQVVLQHVSGDPVFLSFGADVPVVDTGLVLSASASSITITGLRAMLAINGICDGVGTAAGTYTTDPEAEVRGGGGDTSALEASSAAIAASVGIGSSMTSVAVNEDAGGPNELIATPGAGHQLWIYGYELHANAGGTYQFLSAATAKTGIMPLAALGGVALASPYPIFKCATNEALNLTSVTCAIDGIITYRDVTL